MIYSEVIYPPDGLSANLEGHPEFWRQGEGLSIFQAPPFHLQQLLTASGEELYAIAQLALM